MNILTKKIGLLFLITLVQFNIQGQQLIINEFVSSNSTSISDSDGDFNDWIEIYNPQDSAINLLNYGLSDNEDLIARWHFPDTIIPAKGFIIIHASGKDKFGNNEIHANFKISQSGEPIILSNSSDEIISQTSPAFVPTDKSYGCLTDGTEPYIISSNPTPNGSNNNTGNVYCSHPSGLYTTSVSLHLQTANPYHEIRYTTNGNIPTDSSLLYTSSLVLTNNTQSPNRYSTIPTTPLSGPKRLNEYIWKEPKSVYKCNVIRYAAFENGVIQGDVYTKSYFIDHEIHGRYTMPIVSLVTDSLNLFDHDTGIYIPGKTFDELGFDYFPSGNYHNGGELWERDIHLTYLTNTGLLIFETDAGMRMRGMSSAINPQKAFNAYFKSEYGMSKIEYPLFDHSQAEKFKRLIFRNSGRDFLFSHFKDAMLHRVMSTMDLEIQDSKPVVVFFNGEYWGIHNLREKHDKYYFKYKYGIAEEDINILGICGAVDEGDNTSYREVTSFIAENDLTLDENYAYVTDRIDINNFIDFQITEIYFANADWPCNNFKIWKDNQPDSKWRFLIYDLDASFGSAENCAYTTRSLEIASNSGNEWPNCPCSNVVFRSLLKNDKFTERFLARFAECLKTTFNPDSIIGIIDEFETVYAKEIKEHIDRWNYPSSVSLWEQNVDSLRTFATRRPCYMVNNIVQFFNLSSFEFDCSVGNIELESNNQLRLIPNPNNGLFALYNDSLEEIVNASATVINSLGTIVYTQEDIFIGKNSKYFFNIDNLPNSVYVLRLRYNNKATNIKMVLNSSY